MLFSSKKALLLNFFICQIYSNILSRMKSEQGLILGDFLERVFQKKHFWSHWRRGLVVIASVYRTEYPGFESRQGVGFFEIYSLQYCCHNLKKHCHCVYLSKINYYKIFKNHFWAHWQQQQTAPSQNRFCLLVNIKATLVYGLIKGEEYIGNMSRANVILRHLSTLHTFNLLGKWR
jgi:hypothetical protein